jgi:hypothetical protein
MTREEQLAFCKICINKELDPKQGLLCGLTKKKADFKENCADFDKDEKEAAYMLKQEMAASGDDTVGDPHDFEKNKKKGVMIMAISGIILLISLALGFMPILAAIAFIFGSVMLYRGIQQEKIYMEYQEKDKINSTEKSNS